MILFFSHTAVPPSEMQNQNVEGWWLWVEAENIGAVAVEMAGNVMILLKWSAMIHEREEWDE